MVDITVVGAPAISYRPMCAVAFIDVLGWRELVSKSKFDDTLLKTMAVALGDAGQQYNRLASGGSLRIDMGLGLVNQFSDSIVVSLDRGRGDPWSSDSFFSAIDKLCDGLLRYGLFMRGGIACGELFHRSTVVFGPALTEAYDTESGVSKYPRIVAGPSFSFSDEDKKTWFRRASDGQWFFDVLRVNVVPAGQGAYLDIVRPHVIRNLDEHSRSDNWYVLKKYIWFAEYFNEVARECGAPEIELPEYRAVRLRHLRHFQQKLKTARQQVDDLKVKVNDLRRSLAPKRL